MSQPKLSREELLRRATNAANHGLPAQGPILEDAPAEPEPTAERRIYDRRSLRKSEPGRCEWYTMPDGSEVCVHGVSIEEAAWLNRQALKEIHALGILPRPEETGDARTIKQEEAQLEARLRGQVWQVVAACRTGEAPNSPAVFDAGDAESLRRNRYLLESITAICAISDKCSAGRSEADLLRERYADFFGEMGSWLRTCALQLSADSWENCRTELLACANSVSAMKRPAPLPPQSPAE